MVSVGLPVPVPSDARILPLAVVDAAICKTENKAQSPQDLVYRDIEQHKGYGVQTIHLRRPWTRVFFRLASRTVGFNLRLKNSGHVIIFLQRFGLQNSVHVKPF